MIKIGIDPSLNCTGVCIWDINRNINSYYMIPSKVTKKMSMFTHERICILPYNRIDTKNLEYTEKERCKFDNIYNIGKSIGGILDTFNPTEVFMEGISYGSLGSAALIDLAFLNAVIRAELKRRNIKFNIISPTSLKKFACANGQAEKSVIIDAWKRLDTNIMNVKDIKVDDLADSFFLAHYKFET